MIGQSFVLSFLLMNPVNLLSKGLDKAQRYHP